MILSLIIPAFLLFVACILRRHLIVINQFKNVPGAKHYFFIGHALEAFAPPDVIFGIGRKWAKQFNGIYKFMALNAALINIYNPQDIETILSSTKNDEKGFIYSFLKEWLGSGLLLSQGKKWHERRKILTPTFHFNILNKFCFVFEEISQKTVEKIKDRVGQPVDVTSIITELTLMATCETAMGTRIQEHDDNWINYKNAVLQVGYLVLQRIRIFPYYSDFIFRLSPEYRKQTKALKTLHGFTKQLIEDRKEYFKSDAHNLASVDVRRNKRTPMLDLLIAAKEEGLIDDAGIQEEVDTFMFEGHDTTTSAITHCLMALANNPHVQENIFKELETIFGDSSRLATIEDLTNLRYLECCIKESFRLYPPVPFISRIVKDDVVLSGHKIPGGTLCNIHIFDLHRSEELFPDPEKFDPDRFLPENCINRHPYAYIPFSAGPRNCIGQRFAILLVKSALSAILRRYRLLPVTKPTNITFKSDLVLRSCEPVMIIFEDRKQ